MTVVVAAPTRLVLTDAPTVLTVAARGAGSLALRPDPSVVVTAAEQGPPGIQGSAGADGRPGLQGLVGPAGSSFGYARYVQAATDPSAILSAGVKTPINMTIDPTTSRSTLRPPFDPAHLWDGALFRTQARDDVLAIRFNLVATSMVAEGSISFEVITVSAGVSALLQSGILPNQAGQSQTISFSSLILANRADIATAGARLYLTSTVPVRIAQFLLVLVPLDSGS